MIQYLRGLWYDFCYRDITLSKDNIGVIDVRVPRINLHGNVHVHVIPEDIENGYCIGYIAVDKIGNLITNLTDGVVDGIDLRNRVEDLDFTPYR